MVVYWEFLQLSTVLFIEIPYIVSFTLSYGKKKKKGREPNEDKTKFSIMDKSISNTVPTKNQRLNL